MSSWKIRLAIPSRDADLAAVALASREIADPEERAVAYQIAIDAATSGGIRTAGELIDHFERMTEPERREVLDSTREKIGLRSATDEDAHAAFLHANEMARRRAAARPTPAYAICGVHPTGAGGMPVEVPRAKRWHCAAHEHLAEPGDMDPPPLPISFATMTEINPDEVAREQREDERRRQEEEKRRRDRHAEAEATRRARERWIEEHRDDPYVNPWSGPGWRAAP
jgi:hypothetical protein